MKAGIIDPAKVVRTALQNAVSAATMIITTECAVTDLPEPKKPAGGDDTGTDDTGTGKDGKDGCGCSSKAAPGRGAGMLIGLLALVGLRRRKPRAVDEGGDASVA